MFPTSEHPTVRLAAGELLHIDDAWIGVARGRVWVTMAGDDVDHFLERGRTLRLPPHCRAIVGAEGDVAELALLQTAQEPSPLQRLLRWFRRGRDGTPPPPAPA
jgi:hypothetical protein